MEQSTLKWFPYNLDTEDVKFSRKQSQTIETRKAVDKWKSLFENRLFLRGQIVDLMQKQKAKRFSNFIIEPLFRRDAMLIIFFLSNFQWFCYGLEIYDVWSISYFCCWRQWFLEARASHGPGLSVTESVGRSVTL